jgi:lipid-A-disaccharide synthase
LTSSDSAAIAARIRRALIGDYHAVTVTDSSKRAKLPRSWQMLKALGRAARDRRPDVFVAIDFPDFNFRLLPVMQKLASRSSLRQPADLGGEPAVETIRRYVDRMLVIFPFEAQITSKPACPSSSSAIRWSI